MNTPSELTRDHIIEALKTIEDPELFLDIWFLGLIYRIEILDEENAESEAEAQAPGHTVEIDMTFTSPMCPAGPELSSQVQEKVGALPGVRDVKLQIVFTPPWEASVEVKGLLGML